MAKIFKVGDYVAFDYEPYMCMKIVAVHENGLVDINWGGQLILNHETSHLVLSKAIICGKPVNSDNSQKQPTQADCYYIKNGVLYSSYNGKKIGVIR